MSKEKRTLPAAKNDEVLVDIVGMNHEGEGVGRVDGYTLFIKGTLPGEQALVRVLKTKKQYGYAKLVNLVRLSPDRVVAACTIYDQCGGCQLQHMSYEGQLTWKRQLVADNLERIGKLRVLDVSVPRNEDAEEVGQQGVHRPTEGGRYPLNEREPGQGQQGRGQGQEQQEQGQEQQEQGQEQQEQGQGQEQEQQEQGQGQGQGVREQGVVVLPTIGMDDPWRYRNKAQVPMGMIEGKMVGGFYAQGSHRIVDMETCLIQHEYNDVVIAQVKEIGERLGIRVYDEETGQGLLRHVIVRRGFHTSEVMVIFVTNGRRNTARG